MDFGNLIAQANMDAKTQPMVPLHPQAGKQQAKAVPILPGKAMPQPGQAMPILPGQAMPILPGKVTPPGKGKGMPAVPLVPAVPMDAKGKKMMPQMHSIDVDVQDEMCISARASTCDAMNQLCALMTVSSPEANMGFCENAKKFCDMIDPQTTSSEIESKFCLRLSASKELCGTATAVCTGEHANSKFCQRMASLCIA